MKRKIAHFIGRFFRIIILIILTLIVIAFGSIACIIAGPIILSIAIIKTLSEYLNA